jgi:hypothetical protein
MRPQRQERQYKQGKGKGNCKKGTMTQKKSREKQRILEDYPDKYGKNTVYNEKY